MEKLSWWKFNKDDEWMKIYQIILDYDTKYNKKPPNEEKMKKLYNWCNTQLYLKKKNQIKTERLELLEKLSWWKM